MKKVLTQDGLPTFHNELVGEYYHSLSGAKEEAIKKYVEPCKIAERDDVKILDICFGLGYNTAAAIDARKPGAKMEIMALENDWNVLAEIPKIEYPFQCKKLIINVAEKQIAEKDDVKIILMVGDARSIVKFLKQEFDVVFFDPFSPKKAPEMWTEEFFKNVYAVMNPGGILATYSCARSVRENLKKAGFEVMDGPTVKRRGPGTIARKR